MDPSSSLLDSLNQAASTRIPSAQDGLAHASTTVAPPEQVAPQRTIIAPPEQVALQRTINASSALIKVAIEVDGDDSPLSPAFPEVVPLPRWDDFTVKSW